MTGFGVGEAPLGRGRLIVEARAVNGRYLDVKIRTPRELADFCGLVEFETRKHLSRGRCEIAVRTEGAPFGPPVLDKDRAKAAYRALLELRDELAPSADIPLSTLAAVPEIFRSPIERDFDLIGAALVRALDQAISELRKMRQAEGAAMADDLRSRLAVSRSWVARIVARAPEAAEAHARRLRERLGRLLGQLDPSDASSREHPAAVESEPRSASPLVDGVRLEQELAFMAERTDVSEELTRLGIHLSHMEEYVESGDPIGRRLDFLLQEMTREINTIGSKSQDAEIAHAVVELKAEVERMREQVQNVE